MRATKKFENVDVTTKIAINIEELQSLLSCGRQAAVDIGNRAEARIQIGKRVFWNIRKIKEYRTLISY